MKRLAVVVQRCHPQALGGSETLAWHYAQLLRERYEVEILTSCALDYVSWDNALPAGEESRDGVLIRRFPSAFSRGRAFTELHRRMLTEHARGGTLAHWREALSEEFIRVQGPWCPGLIEHLAAHHADYVAVIACTYLYPTSYFALDVVPRAKRVLVPTLHDEPPAYLPAFAQRARECATLLWLTDAERELGRRLWQVDHGEVIGMAVDTVPATPEQREKPYFLYCGRIDESKGLRELLAAFERVRASHEVELVLTGTDALGLSGERGVSFLGHVDDARKTALMAGCTAFVMPSAHESFSIVTLEAMAQGAPVIVNGASAVLEEHVARSGVGHVYCGATECAQQMSQVLTRDAVEREAQATRGRAYVRERYSHENVVAALQTTMAAFI
jgi:glycosyltransferase involved in cell wall biosynthesis